MTQAGDPRAYGDAIARDYGRVDAAAAMLETTLQSTEEHEPQTQQYLCSPALWSLAERAHEPTLVLDAFLLRSLAVAGWAPSFSDCARCGAEGPHRAFNVQSGGAGVCRCRPPGSSARLPRRSPSQPSCPGDWESPTPRGAGTGGRGPDSSPPSSSGTSARCESLRLVERA